MEQRVISIQVLPNYADAEVGHNLMQVLQIQIECLQKRTTWNNVTHIFAINYELLFKCGYSYFAEFGL